MKEHLRKSLQYIEGGLFNAVEKADVGDNYTKLGEQGVDLMGWADPFTPDFSVPPHILNACLEAMKSPVSAHYTAPIGNDDLKREIAKKLKEKNHLDVDPLLQDLIVVYISQCFHVLMKVMKLLYQLHVIQIIFKT